MTAIDIGSTCIDRNTYTTGNYTNIDTANPADYTGKITNVAIWAMSGYDFASAKVAIFYAVDATHYTARSASGNLGVVTSGSAQNFAVNLDVVAGDFIGIYFTDSGDRLEISSSGGTANYYASGDQTECVNQAFSKQDGVAISLYGTGATVAVGTFNYFGYNSS